MGRRIDYPCKRKAVRKRANKVKYKDVRDPGGGGEHIYLGPAYALYFQ